MPKKKLHFILLFTSIFAVLLFLSGCVEEAFVDELIRPDASVRFLQADPNCGTTTFTIYGREVEHEEDVVKAGPITVDYMSVSQYFTIPAGTRKVRVQTTGSVPLDYTTTATVAADNQSTLALMIDETGERVMTTLYERYMYSDEPFKIDTGRGISGALRFRNFADTTLAFVRTGPGTIVNQVQVNVPYYGGSNFYTKVEAGSFRIRCFYGPGRTSTTSYPDPQYRQRQLTDDTFELDANTRYTVALFGTRTSAVVRVYKDDGK